MTKTEMTKELYDIAMRYQTRYHELLNKGHDEFSAKKIIFNAWRREEIKGFGYRRTLRSVEFMLSIKDWFYIDQRTGKILDDDLIREKAFVI